MKKIYQKIHNAYTIYRYNGFRGVVQKVKVKIHSPYKKYIANEVFKEVPKYAYAPKISIITPVYKPILSEFQEMLNSVFFQTYQQYEHILILDGPISEEIENFIFNKKNQKILVLQNTSNQGISNATNKGLATATGEYVAFLDQDDVLSIHALSEYVSELQIKKHDYLYCDEDMLDSRGRRVLPNFKPDWAPHTLLSRMYTNHFSMYRREHIMNIGGFRSEFDGCQDYDLLLRLKDSFNSVSHISQVLYHWRQSENSIAHSINNKKYIIERAEKSISEYLSNRGYKSEISQKDSNLIYDILIHEKQREKISIIIPFKNSIDMTCTCLAYINKLETNHEVECILISNNSEKESLEKIQLFLNENIKFNTILYEYNKPFNYSEINNFGVKQSTGSYILFLNNDVLLTNSKTIDYMLGIAQLDETGAVGTTLLYENATIQHAGVILGYHEVAGHSGVGLERSHPGYYGRNCSLHNFLAVTAANMMIKKSNFLEVEGFDEKLGVAFNDVDLCLKLYEKGYYNVNIGTIQALHLESQTRGYDSITNNRYKKECKYMSQKWQKYIEYDPFYNKNLSRKVGMLYELNTGEDK